MEPILFGNDGKISTRHCLVWSWGVLDTAGAEVYHDWTNTGKHINRWLYQWINSALFSVTVISCRTDGLFGQVGHDAGRLYCRFNFTFKPVLKICLNSSPVWRLLLLLKRVVAYDRFDCAWHTFCVNKSINQDNGGFLLLLFTEVPCQLGVLNQCWQILSVFL